MSKLKLVSFSENAATLAAKIFEPGISRVTMMVASIMSAPILNVLYDNPREAVMQACLMIGIQYLGRILNMTPEEYGDFVAEQVRTTRKQIDTLENLDEAEFKRIIKDSNDYSDETLRIAAAGNEVAEAVVANDVDKVDQIIEGLRAGRTTRQPAYGRTASGEKIILSPSDGKVH